MDSSTSTSESQLENVNQTVLAAYSEKFQKLTRMETYVECILGCGSGGAIYSLLAVSVMLWIQSTVVVIFLAWPFVIIFGFLAGAVLGVLASLFVLAINASLGWPLKTLWFSFVVGGISGFLPFSLLLLTTTQSLPDFDWMFVLVVAVGPFSHMVLGHVCAYWLTEKAVNDHNQRFGIVKYKVSQAEIRSTRFGISHIMILTVWAAVGFALLSCATPEFRIMLVGLYVALQVTAGLVAIIVISLNSRVRRYRKRNVSASDH